VKTIPSRLSVWGRRPFHLDEKDARWRTMERKWMSMSARKQTGSDDVVDMELHCVRCGARMYVPVQQAGAVIVSLERTGAAILICVCGQVQLIRLQRQRQND